MTTSEATGRRIGISVLWSATNTVMLRLTGFILNLVVARLVAPHFFGVFTVAITVATVVGSVAELGVGSALIRENERAARLAPTAVTISLATATALTLLLLGGAPFLARELGAAEATGAVRILAFTIFLAGFSAVPVAILNREFMQREQFVADALFFAAQFAVMFPLILTGHPVLGLAFSRLAAQFVSVATLNLLAPEHYLPGYDRAAGRELMAFGLPLAGTSLLTILITNVDFMVVGRLLGPSDLAYYNLAFNISGWPVSIFSAVLVSVTLPTLARVRNSPDELERHLATGLAAVSAASFPVCGLLAGLAAPVIDVVYGTRWHPAWTALVVLAVFGAARTVLTLFSDLAVALGLTRRLLLIQVLWLVALIPAMLAGVNLWGIAGAGAAHAAVVLLVVAPLYLWTIRRCTPVGTAWIARSAARPLLAALVATAVAVVVTDVISGDLLRLLVGLAAGLIAYSAVAGRWLVATVRTIRAAYWSDAPVAG